MSVLERLKKISLKSEINSYVLYIEGNGFVFESSNVDSFIIELKQWKSNLGNTLYEMVFKPSSELNNVVSVHVLLRTKHEIGKPVRLVKIARNIHQVNNMNVVKDYNLLIFLIDKLNKIVDSLTAEELSMVKQLVEANKKAAIE